MLDAFLPGVYHASFSRCSGGDSRLAPDVMGAPDLAVEILTRSQHAGRFADELQLYLRRGTRMV